MLSYCWKSRKNTESKNPKVVRTFYKDLKCAIGFLLF